MKRRKYHNYVFMVENKYGNETEWSSPVTSIADVRFFAKSAAANRGFYGKCKVTIKDRLDASFEKTINMFMDSWK